MIMHFGDPRLPEDFWDRVQPEYNSGCWLWSYGWTDRGYGSFKNERAHRVSLEAYLGASLGKKFALHRCDTPACVNPNHLFAGTSKDNVGDMWAKRRAAGSPAANAQKTHCKRGHPLTPDNIIPSSAKIGHRACKLCGRIRAAITNPLRYKKGRSLALKHALTNPPKATCTPVGEGR